MASKYYLPLALFLFSAYAGFAIFAFSDRNGTLKLVEHFGTSKVLPGSGEPLKTSFTGIEPIDRLLATLTVFFIPVVDGSNPSLLLHSVNFTGAFGSAWVLVVLEAWRKGNSGKLFSFPSIFGIGAQVATFAVSTPLYLGLQLLGSNTSFQPTAKNIAIPSAVVKSIPLIFVLAYQVPSLAMLIPAPGTITFDQKQLLIALWQPWPVYVSILTTVVSLVCTSSGSDSSPSQLRKSLRTVYTFALANASLNHVITWTISLTSVVKPEFFSEKYLSLLHPSQVFGPYNPFANADLQVQDIGQGVHIFLQWDFLAGTFGVLFWAASVNALARSKVQGKIGWIGFLFKIANFLLLTGPVGTAVQLVWERDELVLEDEIIKSAAKKSL
ncbi:hypothetical protein BGW36DRAFT_390989 [Talaromyces proteolyticus]|uniref:Uncharacterized protein n=1 Tax=Talaromyces proteolyticus TaxID=1131652 RepID=A0AAD4KG17_9EURO|nr:uncharacterized protein BGW36DRAFT_390989 [Talaromyces proteolyticus]KAH8689516.1 hypothetical protein BGW36DRAFT_390989 [Talaromyces proteolyticus]